MISHSVPSILKALTIVRTQPAKATMPGDQSRYFYFFLKKIFDLKEKASREYLKVILISDTLGLP